MREPGYFQDVWKGIVPGSIRQWWSRPRSFGWGGLRRLTPLSRHFGFDRGQPIDRHYIEAFLGKHSPDIHGRVLEVGDAAYTNKFGMPRVTRSDVLHVFPGNPQATIVGNLATGEGIPRAAYDCLILTQVFPFIFDVQAAAEHAHAALKPGGVLLATVPGISQVSRYDMDRWGDFWRFTDASMRQLFSPIFGLENLELETHGNILTVIAFLHGLASRELQPQELDYCDLDYPLIITLRAVKQESAHEA